LHCSYPLRLRQQGYVTSSMPTITKRADFRSFETLKERTLRLQCRAAILRSFHRPPIVTPYTGQKGKRINKNMRLRPPWVSRPLLPLQRIAKYCLAPAAHSPNPFAITSITTCQRAAAIKILLHVHLACQSTPLPMALHAPARMRESLGTKANTNSIIGDSGASISITPNLSNFQGLVILPGTITQRKGIAKGLQMKGQSNVTWAVHVELGNLLILKVSAYHIPSIKVKLLSTTSLLQTYLYKTITIKPNCLTLSGVASNANCRPVPTMVSPINSLPTSEAFNATDPFKAANALVSIVNTVHERNLNPTEAEKQLLHWH
jgi:hypothetical protein